MISQDFLRYVQTNKRAIFTLCCVIGFVAVAVCGVRLVLVEREDRRAAAVSGSDGTDRRETSTTLSIAAAAAPRAVTPGNYGKISKVMMSSPGGAIADHGFLPVVSGRSSRDDFNRPAFGSPNGEIPVERETVPGLMRAETELRGRAVPEKRDDDSGADSGRDEERREAEKGRAFPVKTVDIDQVKGEGNERPTDSKLVKSRKSYDGDLRSLPYVKPVKGERPEREGPELNPVHVGPESENDKDETSSVPVPEAAAPPPIANFAGLDFAAFGNGHPPDTNGDVGPQYFIQSINTSIGIFRKSDGVRVAAFGFNTFMSQGNFGNLCDTNNFGDPVVLYDSFEDRWIITDFAFQLDASNNVIFPPGNFQCFAASKTGDPVAGGWNFYSINTTGGLGDYPKFGIWPDGLYMTTSMFAYAAGGAFINPRAYALNKAQMYAGSPTVQVVSFDLPAADFTVLPSNARLQTGTPPPGTPNYYVSSSQFLNALSVYKFHVDWARTPLSTFSAADVPIASTSWPNAAAPNALSLGGNALDVLATRAMMQNQYTNIGGAESLWDTHTVRRGNTTGFAAPRWYQVNVTGGSVNLTLPQAATWDPDGANVISRFMPSVAVDRAGDLAMGYSTSSSGTKPAIKYAGRLASDPINTFGQTEQLLIQGAGTQTGSCGGTCTRWGDYSTMTLDPDGCTFWYTNMYYAVDGLNHQTQIGSFAYPSCTTVGAGGTISGTVTAIVGGAPISGAIVKLGARTATTNGAGVYAFAALPAGTYTPIVATGSGYLDVSQPTVVVTDGNTTTQDFALAQAPAAGCPTDTALADFQTGATTNTDVAASPGDIKLTIPPSELADQASNPAALSTTNNLSATTWTGQTFRAGITGSLSKITVGLGLASGTSGTITVEIRNLNGINPGTTVLATGTLGPVTNVGTAALYTTTFATPAAVVSGTSYSVVLRTSVGNTVFGVRGSTAGGSTLANGQVFTTVNSGGAWTAVAADLFFTTFVSTPPVFSPSGNFVSNAKDANPAPGMVPTWGTFDFNSLVPANTTLQFQVAGSNNVNGPFNFVGPGTTAATFYTVSGGSLSQFNGLRYVKYKAFLTTADPNATPTINDVTICFTNVAPTSTTLVVNPAIGNINNVALLKATLTNGVTGISGKTIAFTLNGNPAGSAVTDASGLATIPAASLVGIPAGGYPTGVAASFPGELLLVSSNGSSLLTVLPTTAAGVSIEGRVLSTDGFGLNNVRVLLTDSRGVTRTALTSSFGYYRFDSVPAGNSFVLGAGSKRYSFSQRVIEVFDSLTEVDLVAEP